MTERRVYKNRKDANHAEIVAAFRSAGAVVIDCTGDVTIGFDILVAYRGALMAVEIKDGSKPPFARKFSKQEIRRFAELTSVGVTLHVISNVQDAISLLTSVML